jgi:hypothetical protein
VTKNATNSISTLWAIVLLFINPSRLVAYSVNDAIRSQLDTLTAEREEELRKLFQTQFNDSVALIRTSLFTAFFLVGVAIISAITTAAILNCLAVAKSEKWNLIPQFGGIGILLWATLGRVESAIQTWDGSTIPERVDLWLYRSLYIIGSYTLALSVAW